LSRDARAFLRHLRTVRVLWFNVFASVAAGAVMSNSSQGALVSDRHVRENPDLTRLIVHGHSGTVTLDALVWPQSTRPRAGSSPC
jgi:hypothetical protein